MTNEKNKATKAKSFAIIISEAPTNSIPDKPILALEAFSAAIGKQLNLRYLAIHKSAIMPTVVVVSKRTYNSAS